jgi:hypothetical protein
MITLLATHCNIWSWWNVSFLCFLVCNLLFITTWNGVHFEKLIVSANQEISHLLWTLKIHYTRACHLFLSCARWIQPTSSHPFFPK